MNINPDYCGLYLINFIPIKIITEKSFCLMTAKFSYSHDENTILNCTIKDSRNKAACYSSMITYLLFVSKKEKSNNSFGNDKNNSNNSKRYNQTNENEIFFSVESPILSVNFSLNVNDINIFEGNKLSKRILFDITNGFLEIKTKSINPNEIENNANNDNLLNECKFSIENEEQHFKPAKNTAHNLALLKKANISPKAKQLLCSKLSLGKRFFFFYIEENGNHVLLFDFQRIFGMEIYMLLEHEERVLLSKTFNNSYLEFLSSLNNTRKKRKKNQLTTIEQSKNFQKGISTVIKNLFFNLSRKNLTKNNNETNIVFSFDKNKHNLLKRRIDCFDILVHLLFRWNVFSEISINQDSIQDEGMIDKLQYIMDLGKRQIASNTPIERANSGNDSNISLKNKKKQLLRRFFDDKINKDDVLVDHLELLTRAVTMLLDKQQQGINIFVFYDKSVEKDENQALLENHNKKLSRTLSSEKKQLLSLHENGFITKISSESDKSVCYISNTFLGGLCSLTDIFFEINGKRERENEAIENNTLITTDIENIIKNKKICAIPLHFPLHRFSLLMNSLISTKIMIITRDKQHSDFCKNYYNMENITCEDLVELLNRNSNQFKTKPLENLCLNRIWGVTHFNCKCCKWNDKRKQNYLRQVYENSSNPNYEVKIPPRNDKQESTNNLVTSLALQLTKQKSIEYMMHLFFLDTDLYSVDEMSSLLGYFRKFSVESKSKNNKVIKKQVADRICFLGNCDSVGSSSQRNTNLMKILSKVGSHIVFFSGLTPLYQLFDENDYENHDFIRYNQLGNNFTEDERKANIVNHFSTNEILYLNIKQTVYQSMKSLLSSEKIKNGELNKINHCYNTRISLQEEQETPFTVDNNNHVEIEKEQEECLEDWMLVDIFSKTKRDMVIESNNEEIVNISDMNLIENHRSHENKTFNYSIIEIQSLSNQIIVSEIKGRGNCSKRSYKNKPHGRFVEKQTLLEWFSKLLEKHKPKSFNIYSEYFKDFKLINQTSNSIKELFLQYSKKNNLTDKNIEDSLESEVRLFQNSIDGYLYFESEKREINVEYTSTETKERNALKLASISKLDRVDNLEKEKSSSSSSSSIYIINQESFDRNSANLSADQRLDCIPLEMPSIKQINYVRIYSQKVIPPNDLVVFFLSDKTTWNDLRNLVENTKKHIVFILQKDLVLESDNQQCEEGGYNTDEEISATNDNQREQVLFHQDMDFANYDRTCQITENRFYQSNQISSTKISELFSNKNNKQTY